MTRPLRIVVVDDHGVFRDTLASALAAEPDFIVAGHHASVAEAIGTLAAQPVDVVLLDYDLRSERGSALINWAADHDFGGRFLIVTAAIPEDDAIWMLQHGVSGIFLKSNSFGELAAAVRTVADGGQWLDQTFLKLVVDRFANGPAIPHGPLFTQRERAALRLLIEGLTNKEIGEKLEMSEPAVKATVQRLFGKVGVRSRGSLIRLAIQKYRNYL
jgi:two-component system nitrate/nitrite response regulator NarL